MCSLDQNNDKYIISHSGPMGNKAQASAAAAFFAKKNHCSKTSSYSSSLQQLFKQTNFSNLLETQAPFPPPILLTKMESTINGSRTSSSSFGKVKVVLRLGGPLRKASTRGCSFLQMNSKTKQVSLSDPIQRSETVSAPRLFVFDELFSESDSQYNVGSISLSDALISVLGGKDECIFSFGHAHLGKSYTMIGSSESVESLGLIPKALSWISHLSIESKRKISLRVSAVEVSVEDEFRDLLSESACRLTPAHGSLLHNLTEVEMKSPGKGGQILDRALYNRSSCDSHFLLTLVVISSSENKRARLVSKLHFIDFGNCDRSKNGHRITQSALGNVILGIFNGYRHLPSKDSKITRVVKECLGPTSTGATMIAHVTSEAAHYSETLHTIQLASRIHRLRRKKMSSSKGSCSSGSGSGSSDELRHKVLNTFTDPSSSEQSSDTVIYKGPKDLEGTDFESPPVYLPNMNSEDRRGEMSIVLRGSSFEVPPTYPRYSSERNISPSLKSHASTLHRGKMPLFGKVAGYRQLSSPSSPKYGALTPSYLDEHKKSMIQSWVEQQQQSPTPPLSCHSKSVKILTQFKTVESESSSSSSSSSISTDEVLKENPKTDEEEKKKETIKSESHPLRILSEENLHPLDSNSLHFVKNRGHFAAVIEDVVNQENRTLNPKKFDQLAKLHELYQNVSDISAKSQSRLYSKCLTEHSLSPSEEKKKNDDDDDRISQCSEPVTGYLMTHLGMSNSNSKLYNSEVNLRSDSPILEGIDTELSKYAKLKDLEVTYEETHNKTKYLQSNIIPYSPDSSLFSNHTHIARPTLHENKNPVSISSSTQNSVSSRYFDSKYSLRKTHCKSSGYESVNEDSFEILDFDERTIHRYDHRIRLKDINKCKKEQGALLSEMNHVKSLISTKTSERWSSELHVETSGIEKGSPSFLEAFKKETEILRKRVNACKSHVSLYTCFDSSALSLRKNGSGSLSTEILENSCTTECDSVHDIILQPLSQESEIF